VAPNLTFDYQEYQVTTYEDQVPDETILAPLTSLPSSTNLAELDTTVASNVLEMRMVRRTNITTFSGYVKRRLNITFNNGDVDNLQVMYKASAAAVEGTSPAIVAGLSIVADTCSNASHLQNSTCYIDYKYQPNGTSVPDILTLTLAYELATDQMITQNVFLSFVPEIPGTLNPALPQHQNTYGGVDSLNDPTAFALNIGDISYDVPGKEMSFSGIAIDNSNATLAASFLKSWHDFNNITDVTQYPSVWEII
jgi:hypothetical protein